MLTNDQETSELSEPEEFDALVRANYDAVYYVAYSHLGKRELAEDAAQEAFLRAYLAFHKLEDRQRFPAWVCRIARNVALDWYRSAEYRRQSITAALANLPEPENMADNRALNPREQAERNETARRTEALLSQLEPSSREVLLLHHVNGLNFREIGERLGVHPTTIRYRIGKATAAFRKLAGRNFNFDSVMQPRKIARSRLTRAIIVASLLERSSQRALAQKAISSTAVATGSLSSGAASVSGPFSATISALFYAGGVMMATKQTIIIAAAVALAVGTGGYYVRNLVTVSKTRPEVIGNVTIQQSAPGTRKGMGYVQDNKYNFTSATLEEVLAFANHTEKTRTVADPRLDQTRYDIRLNEVAFGWEELSRVLCEKFHIRVHKEKQERDVLVLTAPNGIPASLKKSSGSSLRTEFQTDPSDPTRTIGFKTTSHIRQFYGLVEELLQKPVVNETGIPLTEYFDYEFRWGGIGKNEPAMIKAVADQLRFTLTPARRSIDILFIEPQD